MNEFVVGRGGVGLAVRDYGGDGQPLLMLHGGGDTLATWDGVAPLLRRWFRVIAYDSAGHGRSDTPEDVSLRLLLDEADLVAEATGVRSPILVGHSFGAATALRYAADGRARCAAVVALDPGLWAGGAVLPPVDDELIRSRRYGWVGTEQELEEEVKAWLELSAREFPVERLHVAEAAFRRSFDVGPGRIRRRKPLLEFALKWGSFVRDAATALTPELFDAIECPVLLLCAENGVVGTAEPLVRTLAEKHTNVQLVWLDGGHYLHWERPEEVVSWISLFANSVA